MIFSGKGVTNAFVAVVTLTSGWRAFGQAAAGSKPATEAYELVWADEFERDGPLDGKDWGFESGFVRNQELQWYQPENAVCRGGMLIIEARRESKPNPRYVKPGTDGAKASEPGARGRGAAWQNRETIAYTSASVNTRGKHGWRYGRFEIRAKIDVRAGSWPAFWTLGLQGGWPANGEVDIMEYYAGTILANVAWAGATTPGRRDTWNTKRMPLASFPKGWADEFHTWRMDWDEKSIALYLDGALVNSQDLSKTNNAPTAAGRGGPAPTNPFHTPVYLLLNQAIGGTQGGDPSATEFPVRFLVDYVRVWQTPAQRAKTEAASGPTPPAR